MKSREILIIVAFIIVVCVVSLIPFSNSILSDYLNVNVENMSGNVTSVPTTMRGNVTSVPTKMRGNVTSVPTKMRGNVTSVPTTMSGNVTSVPTTMSGNVTSAPTTMNGNVTSAPTQAVNTPAPLIVKTNTDYLNAVIAALSKPLNNSSDRLSIYTIQGLISSIKSQNAATLLGEIGNPNNLNDPRLFLNYMNWFGSVCPIDSNTCSGIC